VLPYFTGRALFVIASDVMINITLLGLPVCRMLLLKTFDCEHERSNLNMIRTRISLTSLRFCPEEEKEKKNHP
jgi:hypothetical protein